MVCDFLLSSILHNKRGEKQSSMFSLHFTREIGDSSEHQLFCGLKSSDGVATQQTVFTTFRQSTWAASKQVKIEG